MSLAILHLDEHLLAINKPTGLLSVPGIGPDKQDCLASRIQRDFPTARIVHRLDRDTSGVIVMALDPDTHRELSRQFQDRETVKRYVAIVSGLVLEETGTIDLPIRKDMDPANKPRQVIDHEQGRPSKTHWRVLGPPESPRSPALGPLSSMTPCTRLSLNPVTGRTHQLRLHLKSIGHPILGDDLYAPPEARQLADRLMLHAEYLMVTDPYTAAPLEFLAPCPF